MDRPRRGTKIYSDSEARAKGFRSFQAPAVEADRPPAGPEPVLGGPKSFEPLRFRSDTGTQEDLEEYIQKIKYEAELQARRVREKAEEQAIVIEREAYEKGLAKGEARGLRDGVEEARPLVDLAHRLLNELSGLRSRIFRSGEQEMVLLSILIAQRVLLVELAQRPDVVAETVRAALGRVGGAREITLRLNPQDLQLARSLGEDHPLGQLVGGSVRVVVDPSLSRGGCWVETELGEVDATLESRVTAVVEELRGALAPLARKRWEAVRATEVDERAPSAGEEATADDAGDEARYEEPSAGWPQDREVEPEARAGRGEEAEEASADYGVGEQALMEDPLPDSPVEQTAVEPPTRPRVEEDRGLSEDRSAEGGKPEEASVSEEAEDEIPPQAGRGAPDAATAEMADVGEVPDLPASPDEVPTGWDEMLLDDLSEGPGSKRRTPP